MKENKICAYMSVYVDNLIRCHSQPRSVYCESFATVGGRACFLDGRDLERERPWRRSSVSRVFSPVSSHLISSHPIPSRLVPPLHLQPRRIDSSLQLCNILLVLLGRLTCQMAGDGTEDLSARCGRLLRCRQDCGQVLVGKGLELGGVGLHVVVEL